MDQLIEQKEIIFLLDIVKKSRTIYNVTDGVCRFRYNIQERLSACLIVILVMFAVIV